MNEAKKNNSLQSLICVFFCALCVFCYMIPPQKLSRPIGNSWLDAEPCPFCHHTGFASWHMFGLVSKVCDKCLGLGWLTKGHYQRIIDGAFSVPKRDNSENASNLGTEDRQNNSGAVQLTVPANESSSAANFGDFHETSTRRTCPYCGGTGNGSDEIVYAPNYTGEDNSTFCAECGTVGPAHSHVHHICQTCYGKGYVE